MRTLSSWFGLRHKMLHFVQNYVYYLTVEVLEQKFTELENSILKAENLD